LGSNQGLAAHDTLRLEMGFAFTEMTLTITSPLEAGLGWITKFTKSLPTLKT
jgi:aminomethyltransferase